MNNTFDLLTFNTLADVSETTVSDSASVGLTFQPENFASSSVYMGKGMLAIFVTIGIIVIVTAILNKIKTKDKE